MKNKPWKNTQTTIELTSLLDVIFIVLMIVVCNQQINTKASEEAARAKAEEAILVQTEYAEKLEEMSEKQQEAESQLQEAQSRLQEAESTLRQAKQLEAAQEEVVLEKEFYAQQLSVYADIQNQVLPITIYVDYEPSDIKNRTIRILSGSEELPVIAVTPETMTEAFLKMETTLSQVMEAHRNIPIIVSVSRKKILYRDEKAVSESLERLGTRFDNLFLKVETTEEAEENDD